MVGKHYKRANPSKAMEERKEQRVKWTGLIEGKKKHNGMKQTTKKNPTELKKTAESTGKENKEK